MPAYDYIKDPAEIYRRSFAAIDEEADLSELSADMRPVAVRLIHTGGMVDILSDLSYSENAAKLGMHALKEGAPILCDVEMVAAGITRRFLPASNTVRTALSDSQTNVIAAKTNTTRSAAAMDVLSEQFDGAILAIGNAPTALFRALELIRDGAPKPALVLGLPVGFVGAAESKQALVENPYGIPFVTLLGRRGGSAYAAAAVNALALGGMQNG